MTVFVVLNQKGGTGKTTTALNLAAALTEHAYRVLVVDGDPQGHIGRSLGLEEPRAGGTATLFADPDTALSEVSHEVRPNLSIISSDQQLSRAARAAGEADGLFRLADRADEFEKAADVLLVDCPPQLETLSLAALVLGAELVKRGAGGGLLVPVAAEPLAVHGLADLLGTVERLQRRGLAPPIIAVVPTRVDLRTNVAHSVLDLLKDEFPEEVTAPVRLSVKLAEAPDAGQTIFEYDPRGNGSSDYRALAQQLIARIDTLS